MTDPKIAFHGLRWPDDPRTGWWGLGATVAATVSTGLHPLLGFAIPPCAYVVGRARVPRTAPVAAFGFVVALAPAYLGTAWWDPRVWTAVTATAVLLGVLPWLVGRYVRDRKVLAFAEAELARSLEQRQWELAAQTRSRERTRIAREMHDTLGHQLSLIALRAGSLEVGVGATRDQADAAGELRAATTRAAEQLNDIIGLLTDPSEPAPLSPRPELLEAMVHQSAEAGMDVRLERSGPGLDRVSPLTAQAVLRLVQEGLTNAAKHASPGATVEVRIAHSGTGQCAEVEVSVTDHGRQEPVADAVDAVRGGRGLVALADRVEYLDGSMWADPTPDGFCLGARLPAAPDPVAGVRTDDTPPVGLPEELTLRSRRTQRSLLSVVVVPLAALLGIGVCFTSYFTYVTIASVLSPQEFEEIDVGDSQRQVEDILPPVEMLEPPTDRLPAPDEAGAQCRYYEGEISFFARRQVYRICFAHGTVVSANVIAPESAGDRR